jgi:hypothetical protein
MVKIKTKKTEDVLKQKYMNPQDLKIVIPDMSLKECRNKIDELRNWMEAEGYYVPEGTIKIALTEFVERKFFRGNV